MGAIIFVVLVTAVTNCILGNWRSKYAKFSIQWWLLIHGSIPLVVPLRIALEIPQSIIPLLIATAIGAQYCGRKWKGCAGWR